MAARQRRGVERLAARVQHDCIDNATSPVEHLGGDHGSPERGITGRRGGHHGKSAWLDTGPGRYQADCGSPWIAGLLCRGQSIAAEQRCHGNTQHYDQGKPNRQSG
jgi:hypothetical protein